MPPLAVLAGQDVDGDKIYVGRAKHKGDLLPAKVIPCKHKAYVFWGGQEIEKQCLEILTGHNWQWVPSSGGNIPPHACRSGRTSDGELLYVGRGHWNGSMTPGKIHPSHGCLYISFGGKEHRLDAYEVLVQPPETWVPTTGGNLHPGTGIVHAGTDVDGSPIYLGYASHEGDLLPAKVVQGHNHAYVAWGGQEHAMQHYELLTGYGYSWLPGRGGSEPDNALVVGSTSDGEPLYIGRGHWKNSVTPGKIHPSHRCLYMPFAGKEIRLDSYDVLVRR